MKGERTLAPQLADRLLVCFEMSVLDLLSEDELTQHLACERALPYGPLPHSKQALELVPRKKAASESLDMESSLRTA